jgi:ketosteroid isomerase-like protein
MSQQNLEIVQSWLECFVGDEDAFRATIHPEMVWFPFEENHTPSYGVGGAMRIRTNWLEAWEEMQAELEGIVDEGDDVVASIHVSGRGKSSGVEVDVHLHMHFKVRDGQIVYLYEHTDKASAIQAARQKHRQDARYAAESQEGR